MPIAKKVSSRSGSILSEKRAPLAIVGIGCRMPGGVRTPDQLWEMISAGKDGICEVPRDRWDSRRYFSEDPETPGKIYVRHGGFLQQDIRQFDAEFFGMSPREAMSLDPQQRLLLETTCEAIDDAGLSLHRLAGSRTGVYIGGLTLDNMLTQMSAQNCENIGPHCAASSTMTMLSNRLSYFLNVHGPSISIDTACSSSLVALHLACQSIWSAESEIAVVGAVNVMFCPEYMVAMCKGQFLAPDGRSKSFDSRANGYGRGEGAGVIVVKTLEDALRDHDRIYALVRATGCNQDGKTNGITVPNAEAQKSLILTVLESAGLTADDVVYIEAHGTGTPVGDPIEARAIGEALGSQRTSGEPLTMGSVKANLGHMEAAAGMAGLIKLCMCYKYGAIPPVANLGEPNPNIPFDQLGLHLPTTLEPLPSGKDRLFFSINAFGYGGTNAHAILENPPQDVASAREERGQPALLPISARSETALRALVARYREKLTDNAALWREVCAAAGARRTHHNFRVAFAARSCNELIAQIDEWLSTSSGRALKRLDGRSVKPAFVFSGMGTQWWGMGQQLLQAEPAFAAFLEEADKKFQAVSGWSILDEMRRAKDMSRINETVFAQPAIFVLQAGLVHLLSSWGVRPSAVLGHSLGENASAYAAGVLSLDDALFVGYHRSQLLAQAAGLGGMLAVGLTEDEAEALVAPYDGRITIAAINAPKNVTLAGDTDALTEIAARLQAKSVFNRMLKVEVAYHSPFVDPLKKPLIDVLADVKPSRPEIQIYSTVTGSAITELAYDGPYWARNIREAVQFMPALKASIDDGCRLFLEVGAHPALGSSIREYAAYNKADVEVIATLVRETDEQLTLYKSLASLYCSGCELDWTAINGGPVAMLSMPEYPWQRETYWDETEAALEKRIGGPATGLAGRRLDSHQPVWERQLNNRYLPYIDDHVVQKLVLMPGAAFVDAALSVGKDFESAGMPMAVEDLHFRQPLVLDRNDDVVLRSSLDPNSRRIVFYGRSQRQSGWTRHAEARLSARVMSRPAPVDIELLQTFLGGLHDVAAFYARLATLGLEYGPGFRRISELRANRATVLAKLTAGEQAKGYDVEHVLHPALLDGAFQSLLASIPNDNSTGFVPASIDQVAVFEAIPDDVWCYGRITNQEDDAVVGNISLIDQDGRILATVTGLRCAKVALANRSETAVLDRRLLHPVWRETALESNNKRAGLWMLFAEGGFPEHSFAALVADGLSRAGCEDVLTFGVDIQESGLAGKICADLFQHVGAEGLAGIAYIASDNGSEDVDASIARARQLLELFKCLPANDSHLRAYLITAQAEFVDAGDRARGFRQASAAGFFRVAHNEFPGLNCSVIDHDGDPASAGDVVAELLADDEADDVAWRAGVRFAQRMEATTVSELEKGNLTNCAVASSVDNRYVLSQTGNSASDVFYWKQDAVRELADDEIDIEVAYWHVEDFGDGGRDVSKLEWSRPKQREFSGRIRRAGRSASHRAGECIAAAARCQLGSHVIVRERDLRAITLNGTPAAASSSLAITAASVRVALQHMARAQNGEGILVASNSGNEAARMFVIAAKRLGLNVVVAFDDDGDESFGFDDVQTLDLRSDDFGLRAEAANNGRPLDIAVFCGTINPALHNRIPLALGGRVIFHGRAAESVDPARFLDHVTTYSLHRLNPAALAAANLPAYQAALNGLESFFSDAGSERLCTANDFATQADERFRERRAFTIDMTASPRIVPPHASETRIDAEGIYVLTGGFGGFGLVVADHLIEQGARRLVLIGRSGAATDEARQRIAAWRAQNVSVHEARLDIANATAVDALFADLQSHGPVKGIFHAAGFVDDGRIIDMTGDQLERVMQPKVLGAWNLHAASLRYRLPLDHFVLFSSAASLVGNGGQANYVAANALLDSFSYYRRGQGLPATSINWGALAGVGMATDEDLQRQFKLMGIIPFSGAEAMSGLDAVLRFRPGQIGVMDVDWVQWGKFEPTGGKSLRFAHLTGKRGGSGNASLADSLRQLPPEEQFDIAELMLAEKVAETLRIPSERIDVKRPLTDMGIDSLMAVELQIAINMAFGVEFSALELTRGFCISELTVPLMQRMGLSTSVAAGECDERPSAQAQLQPQPDDLSQDELDALFVPPPVPSGALPTQYSC